MAKAKVGVVGAGNVGASCAMTLINKGLCDVVIYDIVEGLPQGKALDMSQSRNPDFHDTRVTGTNKMEDLNGCSVVVVTAGIPRKPGMTREQLLEVNTNIMRDVCNKMKAFNPVPITIVVTNPLDVMTYAAMRLLNETREHVFGMAGVLDSSRMAHFVADAVGASVKDVHAMVLGSHGDSMVALPRYTTVSGIPITELLPSDKIEAINKRTRDGGIEIVNLLKTGSAYYAPGSSAALMVESVIRDENRLLPCAVYLKGEYGLKDVVVGVPAILGAEGIKKVVELKLAPDEQAQLNKSAGVVKENIALLKL